MSNFNISLVKLKHNILAYKTKHQLIADVVQYVYTIQNVDRLKKDPEFILFVCNLIENADKPKDVDFKLLVLAVFHQLFPELNNDLDNQILLNMVDFLRSNNRIKKVSLLHANISKFSSWVAKKFL